MLTNGPVDLNWRRVVDRGGLASERRRGAEKSRGGGKKRAARRRRVGPLERRVERRRRRRRHGPRRRVGRVAVEVALQRSGPVKVVIDLVEDFRVHAFYVGRPFRGTLGGRIAAGVLELGVRLHAGTGGRESSDVAATPSEAGRRGRRVVRSLHAPVSYTHLTLPTKA